MHSDEKSIGIFSGTFDPVHRGHQAAAASYNRSPLIDELWVLPTPQPPNKKQRKLTAFSHRLKMLEIAFRNVENVVVSDLEQSLPTPSYTIQTIHHIRNEYPAYKLFLCIGEDSLAGFTEWYRWEDILDECQLLVASRPSADSSRLGSQLKQKVHFADHKPVAVSSSDIREKIAEGVVTDDITPDVASYIKEHNLYT